MKKKSVKELLGGNSGFDYDSCPPFKPARQPLASDQILQFAVYMYDNFEGVDVEIKDNKFTVSGSMTPKIRKDNDAR